MASPPEYQPAVKFQMISEEVLEHLRSLEEIDAGDISDPESSSDLEDEGIDDSAQASIGKSTPTSSFLFVDPLINLKSRALLDMLSDEPLLELTPPNVSTATETQGKKDGAETVNPGKRPINWNW